MGFDRQENNVGDLITCKRRLRENKTLHLKYVDDLSIAETINLNDQLETVPLDDRPQPDPFRARTGHKLKNESS